MTKVAYNTERIKWGLTKFTALLLPGFFFCFFFQFDFIFLQFHLFLFFLFFSLSCSCHFFFFYFPCVWPSFLLFFLSNCVIRMFLFYFASVLSWTECTYSVISSTPLVSFKFWPARKASFTQPHTNSFHYSVFPKRLMQLFILFNAFLFPSVVGQRRR